MKTMFNNQINVSIKRAAKTVVIALVTLAAFASTSEANAQGFLQRVFSTRCCASYNCRQTPCAYARPTYQYARVSSYACSGCPRYSACSPCSACSKAAQPNACAPCQKADAPNCSNGTCLTDPVYRLADVNGTAVAPCEAIDEYKPEAPAPCDANAEDDELSELEKELVREAIRVRGNGCLLLKFDSLVNRRSQYNTQCQASYCRLGHFSGDSNEIAGVGYGSARAAIQGWLNSPAHRAILLRPNFTKVGACVKRGRDGLLYWTMNFGY